MAHSDLFLSSKLGDLHSSFTNNYLLKHGNIFMKPKVLPNGFPCTFLSPDISYAVPNGVVSAFPSLTAGYDAPLDFAIKHEKPPTPPASTSPVGSKTPPHPDDKTEMQLPNDQAKNVTWIAGTQKLSWDNSTVATYNPETKMFRCVVCNAVGFLSRIAEHYLGTHTSAKVFQCLHCPYSSTWSRCVRMHMAKHHGVPNAPPSLWKGQPLLEEIFLLLTNLKNSVDSQGRDRLDPELCDKKFICPKCPYTTDRRDLYLRHENIHKEDKPYHCYICFKLFNRADHVKKHFLRIHRGHPYDISLVRRRPPRNSSSASSSVKSNSIANGCSAVPAKTDSKDPPEKLPILNGSCKASAGCSKTPGSCVGNKGAVVNKQEVKGFECPFCSWEGADAWCLRRHMAIHTKSYRCPTCEFKAGKPELLFTHVYKAHKMLVCTKCKFVTDQAQKFEQHIKDCCAEIVLGPRLPKSNSEDVNDDSLVSVPTKIKLEPDFPHMPSDLSLKIHSPVPTVPGAKAYPSEKLTEDSDAKASVSIMPLHNSISYCYPSQTSLFANVPALAGTAEDISVKVTEEDGQVGSSKGSTKTSVKTELSSPVQSSSDSGVADVTSDQNELDLTCWHCGCEFANESSLSIHTELYHLTPRISKSSEARRMDKKKFCCALCNFSSNEQTMILDHMRYHTGEALPCRAGHPCTFSTVSDTTLREHVQKEHSDEKPRCPHCGLHCVDRVTFIRHYRRFHHSTSCYRCQSLRRSYGPRRQQDESEVQPYLHHNPYAKAGTSSNTGMLPYVPCNSATSNRAVFIPSSTLSESTRSSEETMDRCPGERRSRKQSTPRKLVQQESASDFEPSISDGSYSTDSNANVIPASKKNRLDGWRRSVKFRKTSVYRKLLHRSEMNSRRTMSYKNRVNLLLSAWTKLDAKFECQTCGERFRHNYQTVIHHRKIHSVF